MGIISNVANRLSTLFAGAPKAEVDRANAALNKVRADLVIADDITPAKPTPFKPNRAARRAHSKGLRFRDRNTAFGNRSAHVTPKHQHKGANDKGYQFALHPLLWYLLARGGYNRAAEGGAA